MFGFVVEVEVVGDGGVGEKVVVLLVLLLRGLLFGFVVDVEFVGGGRVGEVVLVLAEGVVDGVSIGDGGFGGVRCGCGGVC